ncbi:MAG: threonine--tRNA ligase [Candidatus Korarchaeum sp.]|nr:threonine--tRNA ligase [Candidatus Korarchaeum sp.]MDW8035965.1 threonine--tRNA ligase [Candidatus Korarchaeum sp.]
MLLLVRVILPDGTVLNAEEGRRIVDIVPRGVGLVAKASGKLLDLSSVVREELEEIRVLNFDYKEGKEAYWHTTSHILAQAVKRLFREAKLGVGPAIDEGFYYEFDLGGRTFSQEDLELIEEEMGRIVKEDIPIVREEVVREEAISLFKRAGEPYKVELLEEIEEPIVSIYRQGEFFDLCRGPHLPSTGYVKHLKVLQVSSSYWRGDEKNPVMQRVYGISFPHKEMLEEFLIRREEIRKRDHRVIGPQLDLFSMPSEVIGPGLVIWHPKGARARRIIEDFLVRVHLKKGYEIVYSPHIAYSNLWRISGHLDYYRDYMYVFEKEGIEHAVKPMNCPFHILVYKSKRRSYRELPLRLFELGTVYRFERSGVLHGLLRARGFTQDDAHIFTPPDKLEEEIIGIIELNEYLMRAFGFEELKVEVSTWDPRRRSDYMGSDEDWIIAQSALERALGKKSYSYDVMEGEAAFYGPKIDMKLVDSIGREWQLSTIQLDFNLPKRFDLRYVRADGTEEYVVMVHRALLGSIERFMGILIEHYVGNLPLWVAPTQVRVLPVSQAHEDKAEEVLNSLRKEGVRADLRMADSTLSYRVRESELEKIPILVIIGDREANSGTISIRMKSRGNLGSMSLEEFLKAFREELLPPDMR